MTTFTLGQRIKSLRNRVPNMTQQRLAETAGCSREYVARIETDVSVPSLKTLNQISDALGVPLSEAVVGVRISA